MSLNRSLKFVTDDYVQDFYYCAEFGGNPSKGVFWANRWSITKFIYLYPLLSTHLQVRPLTTFSHLMAQMMQTHARVCLLWLWMILQPISGIKLPQNPNFGGVNRCFPAKRGKYWNVHIIKTIASIITKFCIVIMTPKYSLWMVQICPKQIQDGWRPPSWKIEKS